MITWLKYVWTYVFPWRYISSIERTCKHCGSTQELVYAPVIHRYCWVACYPFNGKCRFHRKPES